MTEKSFIRADAVAEELDVSKSYGHVDSHHIRATHSGILTSVNSTAAYATVSPLTQRSPTPHLRAA